MKILINRTDAIGDTLLTLPICEALKEKFPHCHIVYLSSDRCRGLLDIVGNIDEHWIVERHEGLISNFLNFFKKTKAYKADVFIHLGGYQWPILMALLLGVKKRLGLVSKILSIIGLNKGIRQKRSLSGKHEVEMNLEILKEIEIENSKIDQLKIKYESVENELKKMFPTKYKDNLKNIFVHPGMTGHTLNWPIKNYVQLINNLNESHPGKFQFFLSYTPSDQKYIKQFESEMRESPIENLIYFNGAENGLAHYAKCLFNVDLFIGPSTGTTHLANVLNRSVLAFYSPIKAQASVRWRPYFGLGESLEVIEPSISCPERVECRGKSCEYYFCMDDLEVQDALMKSEKLLNLK